MSQPTTPLPVHQWGAITVWPHHVTTPYGTYPMTDTRWSATQSWELQRGTPWWAMILGFATAFTVIGIAFFFVRTTRQWGVVTIDMQSSTGGWWSQTLRVDAPIERNRIINDVALLDRWATNAQPSTHSPHDRSWVGVAPHLAAGVHRTEATRS